MFQHRIRHVRGRIGSVTPTILGCPPNVSCAKNDGSEMFLSGYDSVTINLLYQLMI